MSSKSKASAKPATSSKGVSATTPTPTPLTIPEDVQKITIDIEKTLEQVELKLNSLTSAERPSTLREITTKMPSEDVAKLHLSVAYTLGSLLYMHLKTQGMNPAVHPVMKELERVRHYLIKLREAKAISILSTKKAKEDKRTLTVNPNAAKRIVKHSINTKKEEEEEAEIIEDEDEEEEEEEEDGEEEEEEETPKKKRHF